MNSFINSIINRAIESTQMIQPRVLGKFERDTNSSSTFVPDDSSETFQKGELTHALPGYRSGKESKIPDVASAFATKLVESVNPEISADPVKRPVLQPPLISKIDSKEKDNEQKRLTLKPDYKVIPPKPGSDNFFIQNESGNGQPNYLANLQFNRRKSNSDVDSVQPAEEIYFSNKSEGHMTIKEDILQQELPASRVLPAVLPFKELYNSPSMLSAAANFNTPLKDDNRMGRSAFTSQSSTAIENTQTINISIGRVEVRVSQPPVQALAKPKKEGIAIMSLEEYLDKRNQGSK